jgi:hypothetical protein
MLGMTRHRCGGFGKWAGGKQKTRKAFAMRVFRDLLAEWTGHRSVNKKRF